MYTHRTRGRAGADLCHRVHVVRQAPELRAPAQPAARRALYRLAHAAGQVLQVLPCRPDTLSVKGALTSRVPHTHRTGQCILRVHTIAPRTHLHTRALRGYVQIFMRAATHAADDGWHCTGGMHTYGVPGGRQLIRVSRAGQVLEDPLRQQHSRDLHIHVSAVARQHCREVQLPRNHLPVNATTCSPAQHHLQVQDG